jgi:hypothetical protein
MVLKSIIGYSFLCLVIASFNTNATLMNVDWKDSGDNLITYDDSTGLYWLDLTETSNMSYSTVTTMLGPGEIFEGFRVASYEEAISLWSEFGVNLHSGRYELIEGFDTGVVNASEMLGNIYGIAGNMYGNGNYTTYGVRGFVDYDGNLGDEMRRFMGAWQSIPINNGIAYTTYSSFGEQTITHISPFEGTYLVATEISDVPEPATVWLIGFGVIGLIGTARRKKAKR